MSLDEVPVTHVQKTNSYQDYLYLTMPINIISSSLSRLVLLLCANPFHSFWILVAAMSGSKVGAPRLARCLSPSSCCRISRMNLARRRPWRARSWIWINLMASSSDIFTSSFSWKILAFYSRGDNTSMADNCSVKIHDKGYIFAQKIVVTV